MFELIYKLAEKLTPNIRTSLGFGKLFGWTQKTPSAIMKSVAY